MKAALFMFDSKLWIDKSTHKQGTLYERYCSVCKVLIALIKAFRPEKGSSRYALVMSLSEAWYLCMDIQELTRAKFEKIKKENIPAQILSPMIQLSKLRMILIPLKTLL